MAYQLYGQEAAALKVAQFGFAGANYGTGPVHHPQLVKDVGDVVTNRLGDQVEPLELIPCAIPLA